MPDSRRGEEAFRFRSHDAQFFDFQRREEIRARERHELFAHRAEFDRYDGDRFDRR